jgi:ATP-dependent helicase/nuclease subunit B
MKPLGGLFFRGGTLAEHEDLAPGSGQLGLVAWGRAALLSDLELRLGLPGSVIGYGVRLQQWSKRLADLALKEPRFYSKAYAVDPIGTAATLLGWRDLLVDAGWNGESIRQGGSRLDTFVELEREEAELSPGTADRLRLVESELATAGIAPWEELSLAEPRAAWPGRWQRVFQVLERCGTKVSVSAPAMPATRGDSDLARLQASVRGEETDAGLRGDGSLALLTGETSWETAHAVAAVLGHHVGKSAAVIRGADPRSLDAALAAQGVASLGLTSRSPWRPALQLLPLAMELAYTPRDPYRVLELVTLPIGPFAGWVGLQLARALSAAPGIGGRPWEAAKTKIREGALRTVAGGDAPSETTDDREAVARLAQIAEWLEEPGHDALVGAPRTSLLIVAARVAEWLDQRLRRAFAAPQANLEEGDHGIGVLKAALVQARAFHEALGRDARESLDLVAIRQLLEEVAVADVSLPLAMEEAGRVDVVDSPAGLRCPRDVVVWWQCVNGTQSTLPSEPWRHQEREALKQAGVHLQELAELLAAEAQGWRTALLAAQKRLLLVMPSAAQGSRLDPHPIWDEIVARLGAGPADLARITLRVDDVLACEAALAKEVAPVATVVIPPLLLPASRTQWLVDAERLAGLDHHSPTSLEDLLSCPLHWVLRYRAGLGSGKAIAIPTGALLNGTLGHRLVEGLHDAGAFADARTTESRARELLERLLREEAAVLLRPGMTFELTQLREQLLSSVSALVELLERNRLLLVGVEVQSSAPWGGRRLEGRLDLLLNDAAGNEIVLDLKWGRASYREKLENGLALQLAVYSGMRQIERGAAALPAAAYFSLSRGELLTAEPDVFVGVRPHEGASLAKTWTQLERTVVAAERLLERGVVAATGVRGAGSLLKLAGVEGAEQDKYVEPPPPCNYCEHAGLCGRAWEGFR